MKPLVRDELQPLQWCYDVAVHELFIAIIVTMDEPVEID